mgnify:CR=1 FL=1
MQDPRHSDLETVREVFDKIWNKEINSNTEIVPIPLCWVRAVAEGCMLREGIKVLEIGAGTGRLSLELARLGADVTVTDVSKASIKICGELLNGAGVTHKSAVVNVNAIPFKEASFDAVFSSGLFEHFDKKYVTHFFEEKGRILKKGGRVVVLVPSARGILYRIGKRWMEKHGWWIWGKEKPVWTYRFIKVPGLKFLYEKQIDIFSQLPFLPPAHQPFFKSIFDWLAGGKDDLPWLAKIIGGYLLVSVFEKR